MTNCKFASCWFCHFTSASPLGSEIQFMLSNRDHLASYALLDNFYWYKNFFITCEHLSSYNGSEFKVLDPLKKEFKTIFRATKDSDVREILICDNCIRLWRKKGWLEDFILFFHADFRQPIF